MFPIEEICKVNIVLKSLQKIKATKYNYVIILLGSTAYLRRKNPKIHTLNIVTFVSPKTQVSTYDAESVI